MPRRSVRPLTAIMLGIALVAGCTAASGSASPATGAPAATDDTNGSTTASDGTAPSEADATTVTTTGLVATHEEATDETWDAAAEVAVTLSDGASTGGGTVSVDGDVVTITDAGTYRVTGTLADGQLRVETGDTGIVRLVLDGVDIASSTGAALAVLDAEKVVIILAAGSQNALVDAATYVFPDAAADEPNAALFSTADLTIGGEGSLTVTGRFNDGIASKDGLVVTGGTITVDAADDGIRGKDYLVVRGGTLDITAGGDALKADNEEDSSRGYVHVAAGTVTLEAGTDGVDAVTAAIVSGGTLSIAAGDDGIHAETRVEVAGGSIDVSRSYEGIESIEIVIGGGDISIVAEDDGINVAGGADASGFTAEGGFGGPERGGPGGGPGGETAIEGYHVEVSGGTIVIDAGGDGFDSNGSATVTGGTIVVNGPLSNGNGAIDVNGTFLISDAVLVAAGSLGMAETPSAESAQATLHLAFDSMVAAGTVVEVRAPDGTTIAAYEAPKDFQSLVISTPDVVAGTDYEVLTGGSAAGESLGGYFPEPDITGGTVIGTVAPATR
jgi:hypothetical protein